MKSRDPTQRMGPDTPSTRPIGIVVALHEEVLALRVLLDRARRISIAGLFGLRGQIHNQSVILLASGVGATNAHDATLRLIEETSPRTLIATGFAGAVGPELETGDILLASPLYAPGDTFESVLEAHPLLLEATRSSDFSKTKVLEGRFATVNRVLGTVAAKEAFYAEQNALAVDMESIGVGRAARAHDVPFLCARVILDDARTELPFDPGQLLTSRGGIRWLSAITYFLKHPRLLLQIPAFHDRSRRAGASLSEYFAKLVPKIPETF